MNITISGFGCVSNIGSIDKDDKIKALAYEVALNFDYYDEISPTFPNYLKGESGIFTLQVV